MWPVDSEKAVQARRVCSAHNDSGYYRKAIESRSDETICNIAITLIHQTDVFLRKYLEYVESEFLKNGGIKEQMYNARINFRKKQ